MLRCFMARKKQGLLPLPSPKASLPLRPAMPATPTEPPPAQLGSFSPLTLPPLSNFLDINGDSSPHCLLTQEFLPVQPTTFDDADTTMFSSSAMKSA